VQAIDKKSLSESDICDLFISPAIKSAGWDQMTQVRREVTLAPGPVTVRGNVASRNKKKRKFADYVLYQEPGVPVAVVEAKDNYHTVSQGLQQALGYAVLLDVPSAFSSNGDAFASHNKVPAAGQNRVLLVMATGTGKTYVAFQIIWRLWKAGRVKRALFLADRNILIDQALINDFKPFAGAMIKVTGHKFDPAFEVHLALYQAITGTAEEDKSFKNLSPEFFDLIVIDECHRGSAAEDAQWREILE
jgi:type I site-specific restriction endonuclease